MKPPLGRQITGKMKRSTFGVERSKVQVTRRQVSISRQEDETVNFWGREVQGPGHATSGLQITARRWHGQLLGLRSPRSRSRDVRSPNHGQEDKTVNFWGREVQGPGHATSGLQITDKKMKRWTFAVERSKIQVTRLQVSKSRTRRWNGQLLRSRGPRSRSRDAEVRFRDVAETAFLIPSLE